MTCDENFHKVSRFKFQDSRKRKRKRKRKSSLFEI
jgi:hypothetical protein